MTVFRVTEGMLGDGETAITAHGEQLADGWYYVLDNGEPDGVGPFESSGDAQHAEKHMEAAERLHEIHLLMSELLDEAKDIIGRLNYNTLAARAQSYWIPHIEMNLGDGGNKSFNTTMADTIRELKEEAGHE